MSEPVPIGVVVMAYGTPATPADVETYYTHIRRGRPPTPEQLANLRDRYDALGGVSTLAQRTRDQLAALQTELGDRYRCVLGQKHAAPFIEDAVAELVGDGVTRIVGLVLAPHYSGFSVGEYHRRATEATGTAATYTGIESWHLDDSYVSFLADAVTTALVGLPANHTVLFTAHSLPERLLVDDPYPAQLTATAEAVAARAGLDSWSIGWQSAGATPEPWRGPDVLELLRTIADADEFEGVLVCPHGFVSDHLEVAYDLDIEAKAVADEVGVAFARTAVLNDHQPTFASLAKRIAALA